MSSCEQFKAFDQGSFFPGAQYLIGMNMAQPNFILCSGSDPKGMEPSGRVSFLALMILVSVILSLTVGARIAREKKALNDLQNNQLDSRGLPQPKGPHPSQHYLITHCVVMALMIIAIISYAVLHQAMQDGTLGQFPWSLILPFSQTIGLLDICLGIPITALTCKQKIGKIFWRNLSNGPINVFWRG